MYVFDVDGVITDPSDSKVSAEVLTHVANDLTGGSAVAFNTGRPYEWVQERVLGELEKLCNEDDMAHLLIVSEMGGVVGTYKKGVLHVEIEPSLSLPGEFAEDVLQLLQAQQPGGERLADFMIWDAFKKTMGSLAKREDVSIANYNRVRPILTRELEKLLVTYNLDNFVIGQTTIATDIQHKTVGKHKGAECVLEWLQERGDTPKAFYTFGDSISDKAMAETFAATGIKTTFVFVGDPGQGSKVQGEGYETVVMHGRHSSDTADYLAELA
jgi:hydroxymethylpyrimidine pyrophosphatase-like HAD family hydrolase